MSSFGLRVFRFGAYVSGRSVAEFRVKGLGIGWGLVLRLLFGEGYG